MVEALAVLDAQLLVTLGIVLTALFFGADVWRLSERALDLVPASITARRILRYGLPLWCVAAIALTLVPALRALGTSLAWLQPLLSAGAIFAMAALAASGTVRLAFDRMPLEELIAPNYWRAAFGMGLLAYYTGGVLPRDFALPTAVGDIAVTCLMIVILAIGQRLGRIPPPPLLVWNTLGLLDLVNALYLVATVLRPWALARSTIVGNFALAFFVVPLFIGMHLHIYARLYRERLRRNDKPAQHPLKHDEPGVTSS